ncbi:MAG: hypothetical protein QNL04_06415 [SAR324 cluster bacterium]|nr:hypothetical protein [SAR324 cluster bacterium]
MYYLYINEIKSECKSLEISLEKREHKEWVESEILAGRILQASAWGLSGAFILKAANKKEAETIAQTDPLNGYGLIDLEIIPYTDQLPYLEPYMQEVAGDPVKFNDHLEKDIDCKLVCLDETKSIKVDGFKKITSPQKVKADNVILVLDGMIEAMVDHTLGEVQKFQIYKTAKDFAYQDLAKEGLGEVAAEILSQGPNSRN